jgi:hypothetical protein
LYNPISCLVKIERRIECYLASIEVVKRAGPGTQSARKYNLRSNGGPLIPYGKQIPSEGQSKFKAISREISCNASSTLKPFSSYPVG